MSPNAMTLSVRGGVARSNRSQFCRDFTEVTGQQLVVAALSELKKFDKCYEDDTELERSKYTLYQMAFYARRV